LLFITGYNNLHFILYPGLEKFSCCSTCSALDGFLVLQLKVILAFLHGATVTNSPFAHLHFHSALCSRVTPLQATTAKVNSYSIHTSNGWRVSYYRKMRAQSWAVRMNIQMLVNLPAKY